MLALLRGKGFVYPRFVLSNDYDLVESIGGERPEVVIVHGGRDELIPPEHSAALAATLTAKGMAVTRILRPENGHGGLFNDAFFNPFLVEHVAK
jgi:acetyl esterase/lipase